MIPFFLTVLLASGIPGGDPRYLQDFEFIVKAVRERGAAVKAKRIDWDAAAARLRPAFAACASDVEHVRNCMELLAVLQDGHTGVTRSSVPARDLPGKFDGLFGGGLGFAWNEGRFLLAGTVKGHPVEKEVPPGSMLVAVGGEPAGAVMARERARIIRFAGVSSDHSLFATLGNRLLPFGDRQELELGFLLPDGARKDVNVGKWGPGGKAYDRTAAQLPEGVTWAEGAVSSWLDVPWSKKAGHVRITGKMDAATQKAFDDALDRLQGLEVLLLDCRGMGGGGDGPAWRMSGRLYPKGVANGEHGRIEPSGSWQFGGPVVMLQDELEVSSAETFTWSVSETGRVISVGRPTGGWAIIPEVLECPSGILSFRLGVRDRGTPIRGIRTEGVGWPPDVPVPAGPVFTAMPDAARRLGTEILRVLQAGADREDARKAFRALVDGNVAAFRAFGKKVAAKAKGFDAEALAKAVLDDLRGELKLEAAALGLAGAGPGDDPQTARRIQALIARAKAAGLGAEAAALARRLPARGGG